MKVQTLKGFRDFLPKKARKRQYVIDKIRGVFESYGFEPLETPALEYKEILTGKYGEEEKLIYDFKTRGGDEVALRYDQTVPLARVVAQYQNELPTPFKRYQIQNVWRGENTQKGRYREFLQCDADIVGTNSPTADAQAIIVAASGLYELGFRNFTVSINDRNIFEDVGRTLRANFPNLLKKQLNLFFIIAGAVDKIKKIDKQGVIEELVENGLSKEEAEACLDIVTKQKQTARLVEIFGILDTFSKDFIDREVKFEFAPTLARGLNYYTSTIFEIEIEGYNVGSVCGGGRYDNLIGMFSRRSIPAVGFAYGFDRIMEAIEILGINIPIKSITEVLVTIFPSEGMQDSSLKVASYLREKNKKVELYIGDREDSLEKQLKYASQKEIPYVVIIGPQEAKNGTVTLKNMKTGEQKTVVLEELAADLK